jgi:aryl-alcohol dehydrogenase-like predicted oxidoreductase
MMFGDKTDADESTRIVREAVAQGVNFIDTANMYAGGASETILGAALAGVRDRVVLATKAGIKIGEGPNDAGVSRGHLTRCVEASLRRLQTDRIDLFYVHWPVAAMNLDEMLRSLDDLTRQGKILYAGCSNFPAWLFCRCLGRAEVAGTVPLVAGQYPYNLIERGIEVEVLPMARALKIGVTLYRPLAIGVLTGKYLGATPPRTRGEDDQRIARWTQKYRAGVEALAAFAGERGYAAADAANAWLLAHPAVTSVVVGISRLEQLQANLRGAAWQMTAPEREAVGGFFPTQVTEEAGGKFPEWRRSYEILA